LRAVGLMELYSQKKFPFLESIVISVK